VFGVQAADNGDDNDYNGNNDNSINSDDRKFHGCVLTDCKTFPKHHNINFKRPVPAQVHIPATALVSVAAVAFSILKTTCVPIYLILFTSVNYI